MVLSPRSSGAGPGQLGAGLGLLSRQPDVCPAGQPQRRRRTSRRVSVRKMPFRAFSPSPVCSTTVVECLLCAAGRPVAGERGSVSPGPTGPTRGPQPLLTGHLTCQRATAAVTKAWRGGATPDRPVVSVTTGALGAGRGDGGGVGVASGWSDSRELKSLCSPDE